MIACGMRSRTFKTPGLNEENHVFFLKNLWDARKVRQRLGECFERASSPYLSEDERKRLLTFIIVGGGPTSVEFAGELHEFCAKDVRRWYPDLADHVSIKIVEPSAELLGNFSTDLKKYVMDRFSKYNFDIMTGVACKEIERYEGHKTRAVFTNGDTAPFGMMVWSTGVKSLDFVRNMNLPHSDQQRLITDDKLKVLGTENVYAMGDCAVIQDNALPPVAQVANQQAVYLSAQFNKGAIGLAKSALPSFEYRHKG